MRHTPKAGVGDHLPGSPMKPQGSWPGSIEAAIEMVEDMGFKIGRDCYAIQNYKEYLCFYGPGDHMKGTGQETWKFEKSLKYHGRTRHRASGGGHELQGAHAVQLDQLL